MTEPDPRPRAPFPHCDERVLHGPGECEFCDLYPDKQAARRRMGIAFTGHPPYFGQLPCPADAARPAGSPADHRRWGGNKPTSATGDPAWPIESAASRVMYGDKGGRQPWPLPERIARRLRRPFEDWRKRRRGWRKTPGGWRYP
jgi:hypothetical protein